MFEHASLQELYTGSLIAGKGKKLNNIKVIMERSKLRSEDWARVRFGAGTPWRRCWCVIEPPDEKDYQKLQKTIKKRSAYEKPPVLKGDIKFYDTKKTKKALPIATITDAYSAYAIYPQAKPLIDQSTLVKVEGRITIHSKPESKTEGFVFVMPEVHPAVTGFEMMLRWLFPVYDTFNLYGRPRSLVADTLDTRGLMFAMPRQRRYGYLEIIDVAGLIHTEGSKDWSEREWRKQLKEITSRRMEMIRTDPSSNANQPGTRRGPRNSLPSRPRDLRLDDNVSIRSSPSITGPSNQSTEAVFITPQKADTASPGGPFPLPAHNYHARAVSESVAIPSPSRSRRQKDPYVPSRLSTDHGEAMELLPSAGPPAYRVPSRSGRPSMEAQNGRTSSDGDRRQPSRTAPDDIRQDLKATAPVTPVDEPPAFIHQIGDKPQTRPIAPYDMRRQNSRMSTATLSQMVDATGMRAVNGEAAAAGAAAAWKVRVGARGETGAQGVMGPNQGDEMTADQDVVSEGVVAGKPDIKRTATSGETMSNLLEPPTLQTRSSSERSISRKPLSTQYSGISEAPSAAMQPYGRSRQFGVVQSPIANASVHDESIAHADGHEQKDRLMSLESGQYPNHASAYQSVNTAAVNESVVRPRSGILKTVGDPDFTENAHLQSQNIPLVNFGPTRSLTPLQPSRPITPGSPQVDVQTRPREWSQDRPVSRARLSDQRLSYRGNGSPIEDFGARSNHHSRSSSYENRTLAWQPGATIGTGRQSPGPSITPEQFVQQRAIANRAQPSRYVPQRSRSSGNFTVDRPISGELTRSPTAALPLSRGQSPAIIAQPDYSSRLSAREQEHVARMTGSPLISVPRKNENSSLPVGLVGAIQAREQEKTQMRDGVSGQMVQHAIAARNKQAQAQARAQVQAQQIAYMAYGQHQQQQNVYNGRSYSSSATMLTSYPQVMESHQQADPQTQMYSNDLLLQQNQQGSAQYARPHSGYYGPQDGYQR